MHPIAYINRKTNALVLAAIYDAMIETGQAIADEWEPLYRAKDR